jgi:hypothetical protein
VSNAFNKASVFSSTPFAFPDESHAYLDNVASFAFQELSSKLLATEFIGSPVMKWKSYTVNIPLVDPSKKRIALKSKVSLFITSKGSAIVRMTIEGKSDSREIWSDGLPKSSDGEFLEITLPRRTRPRHFVSVTLQAEVLLLDNQCDAFAEIDDLSILLF